MKPVECVHERDVVLAARSGEWSDALRDHAARCAVCSEVALLAAWFASDAQAASREAALPGASHIWWKAELRARQEAAERAVRPIAVFEKIAFVAGGAVLLAVLRWLWPWLGGWLKHRIALWISAAPADSAPANVVSIACVSSILFVLLVALGVYSAWSEGSAGD